MARKPKAKKKPAGCVRPGRRRKSISDRVVSFWKHAFKAGKQFGKLKVSPRQGLLVESTPGMTARYLKSIPIKIQKAFGNTVTTFHFDPTTGGNLMTAIHTHFTEAAAKPPAVLLITECEKHFPAASKVAMAAQQETTAFLDYTKRFTRKSSILIVAFTKNASKVNEALQTEELYEVL